jgi:hypothetical protein
VWRSQSTSREGLLFFLALRPLRLTRDTTHDDTIVPAPLGRRAPSRRLDYRSPEPVAVLERSISRADPDPHRQPRTITPAVVEVHALLHRDGTRDRVSGRRIRHHQRVADRLNLRTASAADRLAQHVEVLATHMVSRRVTYVL